MYLFSLARIILLTSIICSIGFQVTASPLIGHVRYKRYFPGDQPPPQSRSSDDETSGEGINTSLAATPTPTPAPNAAITDGRTIGLIVGVSLAAIVMFGVACVYARWRDQRQVPGYSPRRGDKDPLPPYKESHENKDKVLDAGPPPPSISESTTTTIAETIEHSESTWFAPPRRLLINQNALPTQIPLPPSPTPEYEEHSLPPLSSEASSARSSTELDSQYSVRGMISTSSIPFPSPQSTIPDSLTSTSQDTSISISLDSNQPTH